MQLNQCRILLTGASGGLGCALAQALAASGAALLLAGRNAGQLAEIKLPANANYQLLQSDLSTPEGLENTAVVAEKFGINVLINNAGISNFGLFSEQKWQDIEPILTTNLAAPMRLTQALLPWLSEQPEAAIINVGSSFGSIPFAGFTAYSTAKAGLRAFSQALRRELADSSIHVIHVSPRAIDTPINSSAVRALNTALGSTMDTPESVAQQIVDLLKNNIAERHIGFPERLFAWLNGAAPSLVDRGLRGKLAQIKQHASNARRK